ncbi:S-adenosyl-L-methionine-dependent methyltransferase [Guyanagaster necrorhizus]|uniref:S-adenosyl-L-methionine-dependent methyltransferase n=1 Tax=Guyanagaster necrorhizus TaxID=856835 RepID=A0A9P8ARI3_9AGAR|nr:S-adenosyl-L-methionine-dependent methyltransferase [Guyanagaster necrorhizus MCA 3950]KAG7445219.1 S-adenosyl-L-methionine-dependent methyltransferase [Guyanagaster necrorhizus MCA 3950]
MAEHHHHHGHDIAEANKDYFNKDSHTYDELHMVKELTEKTAKYIISEGWSFNPESTTVLNFACGTGLIETALISHCKSIQGVDISQGMVDQYNKRAETLGVTSKMNAITYELKGMPEELEGRKFDVVLCTMAYHHFESTDEITRVLAYFLKPGGALLVTDRVSSDPVLKIEDIPEKYGAIVPHRAGFSEEDMRKLFEGAGLGSFSLNVIPGATLDAAFTGLTNQKLFLAKGVKPL